MEGHTHTPNIGAVRRANSHKSDYCPAMAFSGRSSWRRMSNHDSRGFFSPPRRVVLSPVLSISFFRSRLQLRRHEIEFLLNELSLSLLPGISARLFFLLYIRNIIYTPYHIFIIYNVDIDVSRIFPHGCYIVAERERANLIKAWQFRVAIVNCPKFGTPRAESMEARLPSLYI